MSPRDAAPTRTAIVAAADALLEEGGVEAVTLRAVGERAGVSRAAPYRHFPDKSALLVHLGVRTLHDLAGEVRRHAAGLPPVPALVAGCLAYVEHALAWPRHYLLLFGDAPPAPVPEAEAAADDGILAIRELVDAVQALGLLPAAPAREMATIIWVTLHGIAQLQITGHLHEPRTIDAARVPDLVRAALSALGIDAAGAA